MSDPSDEEARSQLISDAVKLALDVSEEGARTLTAFLDDVGPAAADKVSDHLKGVPSKELASGGGRLAKDALAVALNVADAAKISLDQDPELRTRTIATMAQLVSLVGSVFIDTTNEAVGTSPGQLMNRARLVTVDIPSNNQSSVSVWVVNRGAGSVTAAAVSVITGPGRLSARVESPTSLSIGAGQRGKVTLTVRDLGGEVGSFTDALLVVDQVGSIVVRAIVTPAKESSST